MKVVYVGAFAWLALGWIVLLGLGVYVFREFKRRGWLKRDAW